MIPCLNPATAWIADPEAHVALAAKCGLLLDEVRGGCFDEITACARRWVESVKAMVAKCIAGTRGCNPLSTTEGPSR